MNEHQLLEWLKENQDVVSTIEKIKVIRNALGKGNSFSLLDYYDEDKDNPLVNIEIAIDDWEDENNIEGVWFQVLVNGHFEENFERIGEALLYYKKRIEEEKRH